MQRNASNDKDAKSGTSWFQDLHRAAEGGEVDAQGGAWNFPRLGGEKEKPRGAAMDFPSLTEEPPMDAGDDYDRGA